MPDRPAIEPDQGPEPSWLDEVDFDPAGSWLQMGTRSLGPRPWLVVDDRRGAELELKAELVASRHDEVFAATPGCEAAAQATLELVTAELAAMNLPKSDVNPSLHPLDAAGRSVQEDLCLLQRSQLGWVLCAASLCFPSRWRLADKIGRTLLDVHEPVEGYSQKLAKGVDGLIDGLGSRIVLRRNWFIHPDAALFQPDRRAEGDLFVDADRCLDDLYLRSERQTLRLIDDEHALFTIRIQQEPLDRVVASSRRRRSLLRYVSDAPDLTATHRGLGSAQRQSLRACLEALPLEWSSSDFGH